MMNPLTLCNFEGAQWLILNANVPSLVYYSHLSVIFTSIILAFFVLFNNKKSLAGKVLFFTILAFATWIFAALIFWASNRSDVIMFTWSVDLYMEPLVYMGGFYLLYVLIANKDLPFFVKSLFALIFLPVIVFIPTKYGLSGFDVASCLATEGPIALYYIYIVEVFVSLMIIAYTLYRLYKPGIASRKEIIFISVGIILFLLSFAWGNITGSFTEDWQLGQYGLFGMPLFAGFLVYSIVKFKTFNIKLIAAQALIIALWVLVPSILFIRTIDNVRIIVSITSVLLLILGIYLVKSVRKEVRQREQIAKMAEDIRRAYETEKKAKENIDRAYEIEKKAKEEIEQLDKVKDQFLTITQHNLRTPLTSIMGYSDLILNGTYGKQNKKTVEVIKKFQSLGKGMIKMVNDFLDASAFQLGKDIVQLAPGVELKPLVEEVINDLKFKAEEKGIYLKLQQPEGGFVIKADREKLKAAIFNVIDNSIKYTQTGGVTIKFEIRNSKFEIIVSDTGIGIAKDHLQTLFTKMFERGANAKNISGSGVGLYLSYQIIKSHHGKVWAESEGEGKGSTFYIELPLN